MARNPIFAQRELLARRAAEAKSAPQGAASKPGSSAPKAPAPAPPPPKISAREALEALPDADLLEKASTLPDFDESLGRDELIKLLEGR